jgi:uncharacterized RDD family membrane protein YckC
VSGQRPGVVRGHVFISYVREDRERVNRLQAALEGAGIQVWRDSADLWPGQDWRIEIGKAIADDSAAFIACFSENTEARARSYQNEELILAAEQVRRRAPGREWLIPVRFAECSVPPFDLGAGRTLDSLQRIDLFDETWEPGIPRLVGAVLRILYAPGTSPGPGPVSAVPAQPGYVPYEGLARQTLVPAHVYPTAVRQFPARPRYRRRPEQELGAVLSAWTCRPTAAAAAVLAIRRTVQFLFDLTLAFLLYDGIAWAIIYTAVWTFQVSKGSHALGLSAVITAASVTFLSYWVIWPYIHDGQTLGMRILGLQVLSADGARASKTQLLVRAILMYIDAYAVGFLVMLASQGRQRIGDHVAKTVVIPKPSVATLADQGRARATQ